MAKYPATGPMAVKVENPVYDETGILDETECDTETIFGKLLVLKQRGLQILIPGF